MLLACDRGRSDGALNVAAFSWSRAGGCYRAFGVVIVSLIGAQAEVNNFVARCRWDLGGARALSLSSRGLVLALADRKMEGSDVVLESTLFLQLVER